MRDRWKKLVGKTVTEVAGSDDGFKITFDDGSALDYSRYGALSGREDPFIPHVTLRLPDDAPERVGNLRDMVDKALGGE